MVPHQPELPLVLGKLHEVAHWHFSLPNLLSRKHLVHRGIQAHRQAIRIEKPVLAFPITNVSQSLGANLHHTALALWLARLRSLHHQHLARSRHKPIVVCRVDEEIVHPLLDAHRCQQPSHVFYIGIPDQIEDQELTLLFYPHSLLGIHIRR